MRIVSGNTVKLTGGKTYESTGYYLTASYTEGVAGVTIDSAVRVSGGTAEDWTSAVSGASGI